MDNSLSLKQIKALPIICAADTVENGCQQAGIARSSFYSWLNNPVFAEAYDEQKQNMLQEALRTLTKSMNKACKRLDQLIDSKSEAISLDASRYVVDQNLNLNRINQMLERIEKISAYMEQLGI